MFSKKEIETYHETMFRLIKEAEFTIDEKLTDIDNWINSLSSVFVNIYKNKNSIFFIGNGASCSIASHFASDFTKNGEIRSFSNNEGALLTCFGNDFSFENAYMEIIKRYMRDGDCLFAISSSGKSKNIINAANFVKDNYKNSVVITFSGFLSNNPLKKIGNFNLYLGISDYGFVESGHSFFLHLILDLWIQYKNKNL